MIKTLAAALALLTLSLSGQTIPRPAAPFSIQLVNGKKIWLTDYKGKVVIFAGVLTSCPHCQNTTRTLSLIQTEYANKGVQVLAGTLDTEGEIPTKAFIAQYKPTFPVGVSDNLKIMQFAEWSPMQRSFVPYMFFIDKKGQIRAQYMGNDPFYQNESANIHKMLDQLIAEGGGPTAPAAAPKKTATPAKKTS
jgi:peroxiredoxin